MGAIQRLFESKKTVIDLDLLTFSPKVTQKVSWKYIYFCHSQFTWQCFDMSSMVNCHKKVKCVGWSNEENVSFGVIKKVVITSGMY